MLAIMVLLTYIGANAQAKVDLQAGQDVRLAIQGADKNNPPAFVFNSIVRVKAEGYQDKYGYFFVMPEFEYADLRDNYKRYSMNVGYSFNKLFVENFEITAYLGYGIIDRFGHSFNSANLGAELNYSLSDDFKVGFTWQLVDRTELRWRYGKRDIKNSVFVTFTYTIFRIKNRSL